MNPSPESNFFLLVTLSLVGVFFGLLMTVIGWMGNKLYGKVEEMNQSLRQMANELHERITGIDKRLTRVETLEQMCDHSPSRRYNDLKNANGNS